MRARIHNNTRVIDNENNRSLYVGDEIEGALAAEQIALGNATEIEEGASAATAQAEASSTEDVAATQAAIDHAEAMGIDISSIQGSGKDGKVLKSDVEAAVAAKEQSE